MSQLAIEFTPLARRTDPATSIAAGRKAQEKIVVWHERLILDCLRTHGPMTAKEMASILPISSIEISRRSGGLIHTEPKRCRYTNERREGFGVWEVIP